MNIDLNAVLVFAEVVNSQGISKAARALGLPKSTVSRRIRHLEDQLGTALLKRGNRRIAITDAGRDLHAHCTRIAAELEHAGLQAMQLRTTLGGRLRVSMPIDFGIGWLSRAIASFAAHYPQIALEIHVNGRWVDVSEEAYDVAIHLGHIHNLHLPSRHLAVLTRGVYVSPEYAADHGAKLAAGHWRDLECVMTEQQVNEGIWQREDAAASPADTRSRVLVNNIGVARELVISGIGIGILPNLMCRNDVRTGRLRPIPIDPGIASLEAWATFFSGRHLPMKTKVFLDHITDYLGAEAGA